MRPLPPSLQPYWSDPRSVVDVQATERVLWRFPDGEVFLSREDLERRLRYRLPLLAARMRPRGRATLDAAFHLRIYVVCECTAQIARRWTDCLNRVLTSVETLKGRWPKAEIVWVWVGERVRTYGGHSEPPPIIRWEGSNRRNEALMHVAALSEAWLGQGTLNGVALVLMQPGCDSVKPRLSTNVYGAMHALFSTGRVWAEGEVAGDLGYLQELWPQISVSADGERSESIVRPGCSHTVYELRRCTHLVREVPHEKADLHLMVVPTPLCANDLIIVEFKRDYYHGPVWAKAALPGESAIVAPPAATGYRWYVRSEQPRVPLLRHLKLLQEF